MASNLIITFQTKADTSGADKIGKQLEDMKKKMRETALAGNEIGKSFSNLKSILTGAALALPLTGFIKEAIASEEATARFGMQLKAMGQSLAAIDLEGITTRLHQFGITQTELVNALSRGLPYFKNTQNELKYLNTAIGMTRYSGVSLTTALQQLGYVMQYGNTRIARQYGVAMHSEIKEPTQRAIAVMNEFQKAMEPLAVSSGTTAESLKEMVATITDAGEKFATKLLGPVAATAEAFNKLSPAMQETIITSLLLTTALSGLLKIGVALAGLQLFKNIGYGLGLLTLVKNLTDLKDILLIAKTNLGLFAAVASGPFAAALAIILGTGIGAITYMNKLKDTFKENEKTMKSYNDMVTKAMLTRATDATTAISGEEKFQEKILETTKVVENLAIKEHEASIRGISDLASYAKAERERAYSILEGQRSEAQEMAKHNIYSLDQYKKFQYKMTELRIAAMKDGNEKDLAQFNLKMSKEKEELIKAYGDEEDVRLALAKVEAQAEVDIYKKAIDKELEYALMSYEERRKYDEDYQTARSKLAGMSFESFKTAEDSLKALVQSAGGKKALEEQATAWAEQKVQIAETERELQIYRATAAEVAQLYQSNKSKSIEWLKAEEQAIKDKKRAELEEQETGIKSLKSFTREEKTINTKAEFSINTTVNITPSLNELGRVAGDAVQARLNESTKQIEDAVKQRVK